MYYIFILHTTQKSTAILIELMMKCSAAAFFTFNFTNIDCRPPSPSTSTYLPTLNVINDLSIIIYYFLLFLFSSAKPSKVIHLRNIPNDSTDTDVISLGLPFGRVTNVLVLKGKNQAFLEMTDEVAATSMVTCYNVNPPQMRGRIVYVQFSNHRELKTDQNHGVST